MFGVRRGHRDSTDQLLGCSREMERHKQEDEDATPGSMSLADSRLASPKSPLRAAGLPVTSRPFREPKDQQKTSFQDVASQ